MSVPSTITDLSVSAASNSPAGSDPIGTSLDDYLRSIQAILRREQSQGVPVPSASTVNIGASTDGNYVHITGTTAITSLGTVGAGITRTVVFDGALTLTHNATSLILPGAANITTAAGDIAEFTSEGAGNWRCTRYIKANSPYATYLDIQTQSANSATTAGSAPNLTFASTLGAGVAYAANQLHSITFNASGGTTVSRDGLANVNLKQYDSTGAKVTYTSVANVKTFIVHDGTDYVVLNPLPPAAVVQSVPNNYLTGLTLSTAGSSTTMTIAAGQAADSSASVLMTLVASISKTTSAWAVGSGNGGLDTGAIANSTWYYFYEILRPDTGVIDVCFSLSSVSPTLPANYTKYRYIGAGLTNSSGKWVQFSQVGSEFSWNTPVEDFAGAGSTTASLLTVSVPRNRSKVFLNVTVATSSGAAVLTYLSDPNNADLLPSSTANPGISAGYVTASSNGYGGSQATVWSNTSAQIRHREASTSSTLRIATLGWFDPNIRP